MSAPTAAGDQSHVSETPQSAAHTPTQAAQADSQAGDQVAQAPVQAPAQAPAQAPVQAQGDIAIDDSNSAYSDELSVFP